MNPLDPNLVGYLLDALDQTEREAVENYLHASPEARRKLDRLRSALIPLDDTRALDVPPAGLAQRTLARVGALPRLPLPAAPRVSPSQAQPRGWWRRSEVIAASVLGLIALGVAAGWIFKASRESEKIACQENLHQIHRALTDYADERNGVFPRVEATGPHAFAGIFVPVLADSGCLTQNVSLSCPTQGQYHAPEGMQLRNLDDWYASNRGRYKEAVRSLSNCYAYTLGYRDQAGLNGLRRGVNPDQTPILADRPPFDAGAVGVEGNSLNHGGKGQNVLFIGGDVRFVTTRTFGPDADDVYLNDNQRVLAGVRQRDNVLAASDASP
jgi:hypothetical protein